MHIYFMIKQCPNHKKIWQQNVLLKQKVMFISARFLSRETKMINRQTNKGTHRLMVMKKSTRPHTDIYTLYLVELVAQSIMYTRIR